MMKGLLTLDMALYMEDKRYFMDMFDSLLDLDVKEPIYCVFLILGLKEKKMAHINKGEIQGD